MENILLKKIVLKQSVIAVALTLSSSQLVYAQLAPQEPALQKILITGSNLKRADKEGTSPVDVITAKDIKDSGASTVAELMKLVPSMGTDTNQDQPGGTGFAKGVATASLRGLGSSSTLILLNGRRMTPSAYADPNNGNSTLYDLNSIPLSALDRVEILKDGASAVYGSDAIGGVINFITKSNYRGGQIAGNVGANDDDRFRRKNVSGFFGTGDLDTDGYNIFAAVDFSERDRVARRDVNDIAYINLPGPERPLPLQLLEFRLEIRNGLPRIVARLAQLRRDASERATARDVQSGLRPVGTHYGWHQGWPAANQHAHRPHFLQLQCRSVPGRPGDGKDASVLSRGTLKISNARHRLCRSAPTRVRARSTPVRRSPSAPPRSPTSRRPGLADPFQAILPIGHPDNPLTECPRLGRLPL